MSYSTLRYTLLLISIIGIIYIVRIIITYIQCHTVLDYYLILYRIITYRLSLPMSYSTNNIYNLITSIGLFITSRCPAVTLIYVVR